MMNHIFMELEFSLTSHIDGYILKIFYQMRRIRTFLKEKPSTHCPVSSIHDDFSYKPFSMMPKIGRDI